MDFPRPAQTRLRTPIAVQIGYASGNLGKSLLWSSFESFLLFYLVTLAGFSAWLAGGVLAAAMVWDGLADLGVAYMTDRYGKANALARLVLWGAPLGAIGFWLTFEPATGQAWPAVIAAILLCRLGYTLCDIGHNTLLVRVATNPREASMVSGLRLVFSAIGGAMVGGAAGRLLSITDPVARQHAFGAYAAAAGCIYVATLLCAIAATHHIPIAAGRLPQTGSGAPLRALWRDRPFRFLLTIVALQAGLLPAFNRALPFFGAAMMGDPAWSGYALTMVTFGQSLSLPIWMLLSRWHAPARLLAGAHGLTLGVMAAIGLLAHSAFEGVPLFLFGTAQAGMNMAIWALLARCVHESANREARLEALPVGLFLAALKCSAGLGNVLIAWIVGSMQDQDAGTGAMPVVIAALFLPAAGCCGILALLGWRWLQERRTVLVPDHGNST